MARRETYSDSFNGEADKGIRALLGEADDEPDGRISWLKKILLNVIKNELTPRQREIIMLYYFKEMDIVRIGSLLGITPQAVSAAMKRAHITIYRYLQYYI